MFETLFDHPSDNLDSLLSLYLLILCYNLGKKEKLSTFSELPGGSIDNQMRFSNKNKRIANYDPCFKLKKVQPSEQKNDQEQINSWIVKTIRKKKSETVKNIEVQASVRFFSHKNWVLHLLQCDS